MKQTRREFMKDAAIVGTVVAAGSTISSEKIGADQKDVSTEKAKCPFFDQPLMCNGPDENGNYRCDK